jgi:hypothetical protein
MSEELSDLDVIKIKLIWHKVLKRKKGPEALKLFSLFELLKQNLAFGFFSVIKSRAHTICCFGFFIIHSFETRGI